MRHVFAFPLALGFVWMVAHPASSSTLALKLQGQDKTTDGKHGDKDEGEVDDDSLVFKPTVPEEKPTPEKRQEQSVIRAFWRNMSKKQAKANREILLKRRDKEQPNRVQIKDKKKRKDTVIRGLEKFEKHLEREGKDVNVKKLEEKGKEALRKLVDKDKATGARYLKYEVERWEGYSKALDEIPEKSNCATKTLLVNELLRVVKLYTDLRKRRAEEEAEKRKEGFYLRFHHFKPTQAEIDFRTKAESMLLKCKL